MSSPRILLALLLLTMSSLPLFATPLTSQFTWQGQLKISGLPANGTYTLSFDLYDVASGGTPLNPVPLTRTLTISQGLISTSLDFGITPVQGQQLWLNIRLTDGPTTVTLAPRQAIQANLYALHALTAEEALVAGPNSVNTDSIVNMSIVGADIANFSIVDDHIAANTISSASIKNGTIVGIDLANASVSNAHLTANSVNSNNIVDGTVLAADLASGSVGADEIASAAVGTTEIIDGSVTGTDINNSTITADDVALNTLTALEIATAAIGSTEIADGAVGSADLAPSIGIGNTNPAFPLDVQGRMRVRGDAAANGSSGGIWFTEAGAPLVDKSYVGRGDATSNFTGVYSNTSGWQFIVNDGGQIGIGTTALGAHKLTVRTPGAPANILIEGGVISGRVSSIQMSTGFADAGISYDITNAADDDAQLSASSGLATLNLSHDCNLNGCDRRLSFNGSLAEKPGGGPWAVASDARLKTAVQPLHNVLDHLLELRGVSFEYIDAHSGRYPSGRQTGFIAQEVEAVFPDWVTIAGDGFRRIASRGFEALAVEALRELRAEKDVEIAELRAQNQVLSDRLTRLEALLTPVSNAETGHAPH